MNSNYWAILKLYFFVFLLFGIDAVWAQNEVPNYYWVQFKDKAGTLYSIQHPEEFLSERAIERRLKQHIALEESDLPVSTAYLQQLTGHGAKIIHTSKWLNGATISATETEYQSIIDNSDFIIFSQLTKPGTFLKSTHSKFVRENQLNTIPRAAYGLSIHQLEVFNGQSLHAGYYFGEGIHIAVLDAGFYKADELSAFQYLFEEDKVLSTRDFVTQRGNVFSEHPHGTSVFSAMGGRVSGQLIGTAPEASYHLLRSEDSATEYLIEEDNWVAAAEYADSVGCDIINSSLGYYKFDDESMNHEYADMDGQTTRVTRAANKAVEKGMLVFASAGNEASDPWKYIIAPSDGDMVIGVGAVSPDSIWAPFSSLGPASDGDIKPNLVAVGWGTIVQQQDGRISASNGTSFSSPVLAGMAACLWQAFPAATNWQIKEAIEKSASQYTTPDDKIGYGIPDFHLASLLLQDPGPEVTAPKWLAVPNPFSDHLYFYHPAPSSAQEIMVSLFSIEGRCLFKQVFPNHRSIYLLNLANLPSGIILARIETHTETSVIKLIKGD